MTDTEEETEDSDTGESIRGKDSLKRVAILKLHGRQADSVEGELKAWSEILAEEEERFQRKKGFFGRWRRSKGSRAKSSNRKR